MIASCRIHEDGCIDAGFLPCWVQPAANPICSESASASFCASAKACISGVFVRMAPAMKRISQLES